MMNRGSQLSAIHNAIAVTLGVNPALLRRETRIFQDVSHEPVSLQAVLDRLEERFSIDFTLDEVACLFGRDTLTVGDLVDAVDEAIDRAAAALEDVVSRAEEAFT